MARLSLKHENVISAVASERRVRHTQRIPTLAPIRCRAASEVPGKKKEREEKSESKRWNERPRQRCRYLPATFLYCKRQGALKVNPADRTEASSVPATHGGIRYPRSMYKRKLHSKFYAIPIRKLFFFAVTFSFFFQRAFSPAVFCNAATLPAFVPLALYTFRAAGGIAGDPRSHFL